MPFITLLSWHFRWKQQKQKVIRVNNTALPSRSNIMMARSPEKNWMFLQIIILAQLLHMPTGMGKIQDATSAYSNKTATRLLSDRIFKPRTTSTTTTLPPNEPSCTCGVKGHQDVKIVGGVLSKQHCWPWVAAIVFVEKKKQGVQAICGASVLGHQHLLTAAHCISFMLEEGLANFRVVLGTNDLNDKDALIVPIESVISHPKYGVDQQHDSDVGIITLKDPVPFSKSIMPICLTPQKEVPYVGKSAVVAGWGSTYSGGETITMQMQVMLDVISNSECQALYSNESRITQTMMCARRLNKDSCQGDSGGPLFLLQEGSNDRYLQIGIVSFGFGCADNRYPGVYSRVSRFTKWIMRKIGSDGDCTVSTTRRRGAGSSRN